MMWHWNSLWAPAPGDPPAVDDPALWKAPWSAEQVIALQARAWETMLSASHSWWSAVLAAWPVGTPWPLQAWSSPTLDGAATAGAEPLLAKPPAAQTEARPAKRATPARKRSTAARKR